MEFDIKGLFDNLEGGLLMKAVRLGGLENLLESSDIVRAGGVIPSFHLMYY